MPLDPDFPADRLAFYISDSKMPIIVGHEKLLDRVVGRIGTDSTSRCCGTVRIDGDAEIIAKQPATNPNAITKPENLVYVLYTSGSTGRARVVVEDFDLGSPSHAEVKILDDDTGAPASNPIDDASFFVRQHYLDFLNREPDAASPVF